MLRWCLACVVVFAARLAGAVELRDGDIVFQQSKSSQSAAVAAATHSRYTHMGMIRLRDGKPVVVEAVQPVKETPYAAWVARGVGKHVVVKRFSEPLTDDSLKRMHAIEDSFLGKAYDLAFAWDDERIYCSELVWKVYDRGAGVQLGTVQKLRDFDLTHAAVRAKLAERYGAAIPLDEDVISPQAIFEDPRLVVID